MTGALADPKKADFEKDLNCMIDCMKAENFSEIFIPKTNFYLRRICKPCF